MADQQVIEQEQKTETADVSSILQRAAFGDNESSQQTNAEVKTDNADTKIEEVKTETKVEEEIVVPTAWIKKEFDVEDVTVLKSEREELKTAREKLKKFDLDENSLKIFDYLKPEKEDDLYNYLSTKKKVEKLSSGEVTENNAAEIVKFQLQQKYNTLSEEDINYKFNKQYGIPKEPQEYKFLTTEDYQEAKSDWDQKVVDAKRELLLDAKLALPEIQKLKTELILPEITRNEQQKAPTQADLDAAQKVVDSFLQSAETFNKDFTGFSVQVKDKDVDYAVNYTVSPEEKSMVMGKLKTFAESGFDANSLLADRWVSEDGKSLKTDQMIKDLSRLFGDDRISQKIAVDSGNKRLEAYLKDKKQIDLNVTNEEGKLQLDKEKGSVEDKLRERMLQL